MLNSRYGYASYPSIIFFSWASEYRVHCRMENLSEQDKIMTDLQLAAISTRGHIIHRTTELEFLIDIYISRHFTADEVKMEELVCLILAPRMTFENKRVVFLFLVDKYIPEFKKSHPDFFNDLQKISENRNMFAHYPIDDTPNAIERYRESKMVHYVKFKNSKNGLVNSEGFSSDDANKITGLIYNCIDVVRGLVRSSQQLPPLNEGIL